MNSAVSRPQRGPDEPIPAGTSLSTGARYVVSFLLVACATFLLWLLRDRLTIANSSLLFMLITLIVAVWLGTGPSVLAAFLCFFSFNYFLIQPYYTLAVQDPREVLDLVVFLAVALIAGRLAGYARRQAEAARQNAREKDILYGLSSALNPLTEPAAIRDELRRVAAEDLGAVQVDILPDEASEPTPAALPTQFVLLQAGDRIYGTLRAVFPGPISPANHRLLGTCVAQAALALQRVDLTREAEQSRALAAADRLKTALLQAVSHDLRTPITIIKTSAANLEELRDQLSDEQRRELAANIETEADELDRLVGNLLDMSRLQAGAVVLNADWNALEEIAGEVAARAFQIHRAERIALDFPDENLLAYCDYGLMLRALGNIVENALRYEPSGKRAIIRGRAADDGLRLDVINHGPTIPDGEKELIMEPFYRSTVDQSRHGQAGLGLAIARGIVETHDGRMWVEDTPGGGATFAISLPQREVAP